MLWVGQDVSESTSTDMPCRLYSHFEDALKGKREQQYVHSAKTKMDAELPRSTYTKSPEGLSSQQLSSAVRLDSMIVNSAVHSMEAKRAQLVQLHATELGTAAELDPHSPTSFPWKGSRRESFVSGLHK